LTALSGKDGNPVIIPIPGASSEKRVLENSKNVDMTAAEMEEIQGVLSKFKVSGTRYPEAHMGLTEG
jgi:pyridoxine 4-dehydrogenase